MNDLTVSCGCGRTMALEARRGRGAYRCGCGARIVIAAPPSAAEATCLGLSDSGTPCPMRPSTSPTEIGIPLCLDHLENYRRYLTTIEEGERWGELMKEAWEDSRVAMDKQLASHSPWRENYDAARRRAYSTQSLVYYIRIGDTIKIGVTTNMKARMAQLMPDEILAAEPGGGNLEKQRHSQFTHCRLRGERFRPEPELLDHIAQIREQNGDPQMTGYLYIEGDTARPV